MEGVGDVALSDALGQGFHDGGLAHAGLTDQHRIVLGAAAENLDHPLYFLVSPDHRVQLFRLGGDGEVYPQLIESWGAGVAAGALSRLPGGVAENPVGLGPHLVEGNPETLQDAGGDAFALSEQPDKQMLSADVGVVHAAGFVDGQLDHLLSPRSEANIALSRFLAAADNELHCGTDLGEVHGEAGQHPGGHALGLAHQPKEDVLGADVVVVESLGLFLGQRQDSPGSLGEFLESAAHNVAPAQGVWTSTGAVRVSSGKLAVRQPLPQPRPFGVRA